MTINLGISLDTSPVIIALDSSGVSYSNTDGTFFNKTLRFNYGYPSPITISAVRGTIIRASIIIEESFNIGGTISVGDSLNNQRIIKQLYINENSDDCFEFYPVINYAVSTNILLFLNSSPGTNSGKGIVSIDWVIN